MPMYMDPAGTGKLKPGPRQGNPVTIGPMTRATISAIRSDGWSADDAAPITFDPVAAPQYVVLSRQGFDNTGAPKTYTENTILTKRVRLPAPNNATLDTARVALNTYVYPTDTVVGGSVTNKSAVASPKPICNFVSLDGLTVGNTIRAEVVATHRNARNNEGIACVVFSATDGTNTVTQKVGQSAILAHPGDKAPVIGYGANLDITSLASGPITVNAKVYPWIGGIASVADSSIKPDGVTANVANDASFCPQAFWKNTATVASPVYAYVQVGTTGGAVSTDPAVAATKPFASVVAAAAAISTYTNTTVPRTGGASGCIIRLMQGAQVVGGNINATCTQGALIIEADPAASDPTTCTLNYGSNITAYMNYLYFRNFREVRNNANYWTIKTQAGGVIMRELVSYDNSAGASGYIIAPGQICKFLGFAYVAGNAGGALSGDVRLCRGYSGTGVANTRMWNMVGCSVTGALSASGYTDDGTFIGFNLLMGVTNTFMNPGGAANVNGLALVQNVIEYVSTSINPAFRPSGDGQTGNCTHFCEFNNSYAGGGGNGGAGRNNAYYDETTGTYRAHTLIASKGNIYVQMNQKSDLFVCYTNGQSTDSLSHVNAWSVYYGVDWQGIISQFINAFGYPNDNNSATQCFLGLGSLFGTAAAIVDPKYVNDQATGTKAPTGQTTVAGAGGGNYRTQASSPAKGIVTTSALRFDMDGKPRPAANDDCGAYLVAAS